MMLFRGVFNHLVRKQLGARTVRSLSQYLGGQGDLVSGLIRGITGVTIWVIGEINLLTKSP